MDLSKTKVEPEPATDNFRTNPTKPQSELSSIQLLNQTKDIELQEFFPQRMNSEMVDLVMQFNEPLENDFKLDPGSASSFIDQSIVDHKIQTSVITPMDHVKIAQTLHNPHPDYQDEIITVQIVDQHLKIDDGTILKDKRPQRATCEQKHTLKRLDSYTSGQRQCSLCRRSISNKTKHYSCREKDAKNKSCDYDCCAKCMLSFELRRQLYDKTMQHNLVQLEYFEITDAQLEQTRQKLQFKQRMVVHEEISFSEMPIIRDIEEPKPETISYNSKHAIIGLWRIDNSGYKECYRQFRIDHPVTQKRFLGKAEGDDEDFMLKTFFYVGDKGGLYFFTRTQSQDHLGAKKQKFYLQQFDLDQACSQKSSSLRLYQRNLYFPPLVGEKQAVGNVVDNLLSVIFPNLRGNRKPTLSPFEPQFFESAGYLTLTVFKAVPLNDISNNLVYTKQSNIFFCRLYEPSKIDKVIYNGCVVLKVNVTFNQITDVWYNCDKNLNQISWQNEIDPSQLTTEFLKTKSPEQQLTSCYAFSGKNPAEDVEVKKNLASYLSSKALCTQVQGVMHFNQQRVSFVFTNLDWMTFQINKETNQAVLVFGNDKKSDSRFCFTKEGGLFTCFNLYHEKFVDKKDSNSFIMDFRDLNAELPDFSNQIQQKKKDLKRRNLKVEFKIGNHLQIRDKFSEDKKLPYQFTDFRLKQIDDDEQEFTVSLHFVDSDTYQPNLYFLKGKNIGLGDNQECANQIFVRKQTAIEYPILIQNTDLPLQNQLLVANLSLNEPQKMIDLGEFRFICFVETGLQSISFPFLENNNTSIFFLALQPNGHLKLMQFQTFPWLTHENNLEENKKESVIKIFSGFIPAILAQPTQIKGAAFLYHKGLNDSDLLIKIAIQFYENIEVYSLTNPAYLKQLNPDQSLLEERTAKLHMVCNQNLIFYVKMCGTTEEKIICVHHKGLDISEQVAYTSSFKILQIQAKQDAVPAQNEQSLYIIDSQSRFIEIKCNMKDLTFEVVRTIQMTRAGEIIRKLKIQKWQKLVLSSRSVTTSLLKDRFENLWKGAITYNLTSQSLSKHDFFGYNANGSIYVDKQNPDLNQILIHCQVISVQHLAGIGKILLTVKEGKFCYNLLMHSLDNRRIDLFSYQPTQRELSSDFDFIRNKITVHMKGQILIFDHNYLMQKQTYDFKTIRQSTGIFQQIQSNYVKIEKEIVDKETGKSGLVDMILRINTDGQFTSIFQSVKSFIEKQRTAINKELLTQYNLGGQDEERFWIPKQIPSYFVNMKGALVQPFLLTGKKKESNVEDNEETSRVEQEEMRTFQIVKYNLPQERIIAEFENKEDLTRDEKDFIILVMKNDTLKQTDLRFKQTADFFVIMGKHKIFFKKFALIDEAVKKQKEKLGSRYLNSSLNAEGRPVVQMGEFKEFQGIKTLIESKECFFEFECIDFSQLFTVKEQQGKYKVVLMSQSQELVFAGKKHANVIQILFKDIAVMWDLDQNQELSQMANFSQFSTPETMIPSDFNISNICSSAEDSIVTDPLINFTSDHNIFLQDTQGQGDCVFKMYTMLDLLEIKAIQRSLLQQNFKNSIPIDPESVLAFVHGRTFFQLFQDNPEVISSFLNQLQDTDLPKFIDKNEVESDNIYIRRLFATLKAQTSVEDENIESLISKRYLQKNYDPPKKSGLSILQFALQNNKSSLFLDVLLQIVLFSSEVDISSMITNFEDFKKVINIKSQWVNAFMVKVFKKNSQTEEVYNMPWDGQQKLVVFGADNSQLSSEEIIKEAFKQMMKPNRATNWLTKLIGLLNKCKVGQKFQSPSLKLQSVPVTVKIVEISWLEQNLRDFFVFVTCQNDETLYDVELIRVLLTSQDYSMQLLLRAFLPYTILMGAILYYFSVCVNVPHTEGFFGGEAVGLRCFIFAYQTIFCGVEVVQMVTLKQNYLTDLWNFVYLVEYALTFLVIIEHSTNFLGLDQSQLTQFTACSTILLWSILFYWMRIFSDLGFYVYLIIETLKDTKHFLILVLMVLITFANALYILEIANNPTAPVSDDTALELPTEDDSTNAIDRMIQRAYNSKFIDSVVNQYLLGLGEFQYDGFASNPSGPLIWTLFLLSTFLTQVTFMNMLIAIMSDTFARVLQNEKRYGLQQKTMITTDFIYALTLSKQKTGMHRYLYIIEPAITSVSQDAIESSIANLKKSLASDNTKLGDRIEETNKATSAMMTQVLSISKQMTNLQEQMSGIQDALQKLNQRLN